MAKNVYFEGKLIPAKDWDYDRKRPKVKAKKADKVAEPETQVEVELTPEVIVDLIQD